MIFIRRIKNKKKTGKTKVLVTIFIACFLPQEQG
jgi:hypothetical protein